MRESAVRVSPIVCHAKVRIHAEENENAEDAYVRLIEKVNLGAFGLRTTFAFSLGEGE